MHHVNACHCRRAQVVQSELTSKEKAVLKFSHASNPRLLACDACASAVFQHCIDSRKQVQKGIGNMRRTY